MTSFSFFLAAALSVLLTRLCIPLARRLRLMDHPGNRKTHLNSVAYLGGAALFCALSLALGATLLVFKLPWYSSPDLWACLIPALAASALGLIDDIRDLPARKKFLVQGIIALAFSFFAYSFEILHLPGIKPFAVGWFSVPLTTFFILAVANGMNMIDGSDGLCASSAAASLALCGVVANINGQPQFSLLALSACGACVGFLVWNRPPARIYLGDAGSQGLGFLVACLLVAMGQPTTRLPAFFVGREPCQPCHYQALLMVLVAGYPALEVTLSVARRALQGRSLFRGDQGHLHHRLLKWGLGPAWIARIGATFTLLSGSVAVAFLLHQKGIAAVLMTALVLLLGVALSQLGYARFLERRWLDQRRPHFAVARHFSAMQCAKLILAADLDEALSLVAQNCREFGVARARISLRGRQSKKLPWCWSWDADSHENLGTLQRLRLRGIGTATWVLAPASIEPELEMECRVIVSEFMRKAVEKIHLLYLKAEPAAAILSSQLPVLAPPSIFWLKGRVIWAGSEGS